MIMSQRIEIWEELIGYISCGLPFWFPDFNNLDHSPISYQSVFVSNKTQTKIKTKPNKQTPLN